MTQTALLSATTYSLREGMQVLNAGRSADVTPMPLADRTWRAVAAAAAIGFVAWLVVLGWTGYTASDDFFYATAASGWAFHFPYLAHDHWGLRHAVVFPLALAFRFFGEGEMSLGVPSLLYTVTMVGLSSWVTYRISGYYAALLAAVLLMAVPIVATDASIVTAHPPPAAVIRAG